MNQAELFIGTVRFRVYVLLLAAITTCISSKTINKNEPSDLYTPRESANGLDELSHNYGNILRKGDLIDLLKKIVAIKKIKNLTNKISHENESDENDHTHAGENETESDQDEDSSEHENEFLRKRRMFQIETYY